MPFLGVLVIPMHDDSLNTTVNRKPTHTDLYLQWDSHHTLSSKYSVESTLHHRARAICSSPQLLQKEGEHLHKVLARCKYPAWAHNIIKLKNKAPAQNKINRGTNTPGSNTTNKQRPDMVVPYTKGLRVSLEKVCSKHGVQVYFRA